MGKAAPPTIRVFIKKINMAAETATYHTSTIADTTSTPVTNSPIILHSQSVSSSSPVISLSYSMPLTYASMFYIRND